jgi:hypothetical protein
MTTTHTSDGYEDVCARCMRAEDECRCYVLDMLVARGVAACRGQEADARLRGTCEIENETIERAVISICGNSTNLPRLAQPCAHGSCARIVV